MISLIISVYKRLDNLVLIFQALEKQSYKKFEVIIAEDNNEQETITFIETVRNKYIFPIYHVSQEDTGFLKIKILNAALRITNGEQIVFIDGDCIPHKHFFLAYHHTIKKGIFCYGRRAMLSEKFTDRLLQEQSIKSLTFFNALFSGGKWMAAAVYLPWKRNIHKQHRRILGCNWGVTREDIFNVNGFDEDYTRAGVGEDFDIDWRLKAFGLKVHSMKNKAIVYHLHHPANYNNADTLFVENMMKEKIRQGKVKCDNGIVKNGKYSYS